MKVVGFGIVKVTNILPRSYGREIVERQVLQLLNRESFLNHTTVLFIP